MRSEPVPPDCAMTAGAAPGVMAAHRNCDFEEEQARAAQTIRRELSRLTALLRRHFGPAAEESLLAVLANTSDPVAVDETRAFLAEISALAEALEQDPRRWAGSALTAGAFADFRREALALLTGVGERLAQADLRN